MTDNLVGDKLTTSGRNVVLKAFTNRCRNLKRVLTIERAFETLRGAQTSPDKRPQTPEDSRLSNCGGKKGQVVWLVEQTEARRPGFCRDVDGPANLQTPLLGRDFQQNPTTVPKTIHILQQWVSMFVHENSEIHSGQTFSQSRTKAAVMSGLQQLFCWLWFGKGNEGFLAPGICISITYGHIREHEFVKN